MNMFIEFMKWFALVWVLFGIGVLIRRLTIGYGKRKKLEEIATTTTTTPPSPDTPPIVIPSKFEVFIDAVSSTSGSSESTYTIPYNPTPKKEGGEEDQ